MLREIEKKYYINEKNVWLISGELHYFRVFSDKWKPALDYMKKVGFNFVTAYVPWIWHEIEEDSFDFTGKTDEKRNLVKFLQDINDAGLNVILRPGPYINAEYNGYGIPRWVGKKYPQVIALDYKGKPIKGSFFFQPDPLHPEYLQLVKRWYSAFSDAIKPYLDIIQAIQVDNEAGVMNYLQLGYSDFNPHVVSEYRNWLTEKYNEISQLNSIWRKNFSSFEEIYPPRGKFTVAESTDWQIFYEEYLMRFLDALKSYFKELIPDMPITHNIPGSYFSPTNARLFSNVSDIFGYDIYIKMSHLKHFADFPFLPSIVPELFRSEVNKRAYWVPELGAGWFDPLTPVSDETVIHTILASIAHEAKGFSLYTIHNGIEPDGSFYGYNALFDKNGNPAQKYKSISNLISVIKAHEDLFFGSTLKRDPIGFVVYDDLYRLDPSNFSSAFGMPHLGRSFVFSINLGLLGPAALLLESGIQFKAIYMEHTDRISPDDFKLVFLPSKGQIDSKHYKILKEYVKGGGTLVTYPKPPTHDLYGNVIDTSDLYLYPLSRERWIGTKRMMLNIIRAIIKNRLISHHHEYSKPLIDKISAVEGIMKSKIYGQSMSIKDLGSLKSNIYLASFNVNDDEYNGYITEFGKGKSIIVGTPIAAEYGSAAYFSLKPDVHQLYKSFLKKLFDIASLKLNVDSPNLEIAQKHYDDELDIVFLFNRTPEFQFFNVNDFYAKNSKIELLFSQNNVDVNKFAVYPYDSIVIKISL